MLNSGFIKRCLLCGLASLALFSIVAMAGAGMTVLAKHYVTSLRQDLDELGQQKAALEATAEQLHSQTWGLTLIETDTGRFIVPPPKVKLKPADMASNSDKPLNNREALRQLAPTLLKMRERGFTTGALVELLQEHKITIKGHDLSRYLREAQGEKAAMGKIARPNSEASTEGQSK
jgi:hypothetical protein